MNIAAVRHVSSMRFYCWETPIFDWGELSAHAARVQARARTKMDCNVVCAGGDMKVWKRVGIVKAMAAKLWRGCAKSIAKDDRSSYASINTNIGYWWRARRSAHISSWIRRAIAIVPQLRVFRVRLCCNAGGAV